MQDIESFKRQADENRDVKEIAAQIRNLTRQFSNLSSETTEKFHDHSYSHFSKFNKLPNWELIEASAREMRQHALVGSRMPGMTATSGLKRRLALFMARTILRVAQIFLRDQRAYNLSAINIVEELSMTVKEQRNILAAHEKRIFEMEAQIHLLSSELHGARTRYARIQKDVSQEFRRLEQEIFATKSAVQ